MPVRSKSALFIALLLVISLLLTACGSGGSDLNDRLIAVGTNGIVDLSLADGEEVLLIQKHDESEMIEPALSPDGSTLAYVRHLVPFVIQGQETDFGMDVYFADRDGSNQRLVLEHGELHERIRAPVWLPDSKRLLVNVERISNGRVLRSIELFEPATGQRSVIVEDGLRPDVSPDGSRILYVTQDEGIFQTLWIANADGSDPIAVAGPEDNLGSVISPRFSPDGATIAFAASTLPGETIARPDSSLYVASRGAAIAASSGRLAYHGLPADIWTISTAGGELRLLSPLQLDLPSIDWSGNGDRIFAYAGTGLFVIETEAGSDRRLGDGAFHSQIDWVGEEPTQ
jgi:Tol biopolymer transport system component